ncbi:MAG TPA: helix-turn-helix domain-containing protein, partial [Desulfosalsimonadaceae bacterium]|nr:helix-turn-helix domain-containing protein [Desulfosalsimonadaceae bacterium]
MDRKQAIIESATRLFAEKGFYNTSTPEIAEAAGVAHGTLFYHYTNKEGIILEIFRRAGTIYLEEMESAVAGRNTGMEKLEALLRFNA